MLTLCRIYQTQFTSGDAYPQAQSGIMLENWKPPCPRLVERQMYFIKCPSWFQNFVFTPFYCSVLLQELCLIRFHPATEEEDVAYVSLFSYFSSRERFGVVANNNRRIKDLYLIPLGSKDPLPSKLLPFDGPGKNLKRPLWHHE